MRFVRRWQQCVCVFLGLAGAVPGGLRAAPQTGDGAVRFVYVDATATSVYLVGDFNGWSPSATPLDPENGSWVAQVFLDPGTYEYKFFVDGEWRVDPDNPETSENGNSVVRVGLGATVLPPGVGSTPSPGASGSTEADRLRWFVRYLAFVTSQRDRTLDRWDLLTPLHDVDVGLETDFGSEVSGWVLMNLNNAADPGNLSEVSLRFDRGLLTWRPDSWDLRFFENHGVVEMEDPGRLVGRIGIYGDDFGYVRRGVLVQRKFLGAPFTFLYADDTEDADSVAVAPPPAGTAPAYAASASDRNADALAVRFRAGTADRGVGVSLRADRGAAAGFVTTPADSLVYETHENWTAWGVDVRYRFGRARLVGEYLGGARNADAFRAFPVAGGEPFGAGDAFELDYSHRAIVQVDGGDDSRLRGKPWLRYAYQEHDFSALVTGIPFLMRHNAVEAGVHGRFYGVHADLQLEHHWFDYPVGAGWETQFWFRRHTFWLDEDTARFDRLTLLQADRAAYAGVELGTSLWPAREIDASLRLRYAAPGFDRAPRYLETVVRFEVPLWPGLELRTHSRFATYRRVTTADPGVVAALGAGPHIVAGTLLQQEFPDAAFDSQSFGAHFVEVVYSLTERSDVALGFGVDPWVVYEVRNEYMDIGWDQFLFDQGASPADAFANPETLGERIAAAEAALERERRLTLEARVRF